MATPELTISYDNGVRPTRPVRPRVAIPVTNSYPAAPAFNTSPSLQVPMSARPRTPGGGYPPVVFPFPNVAYQSKASEYMFKRFEGLKDFTKNTAKSGLSFGEKFAFWSYGKLRAWSQNWFTHFFLVLVVFLYTILGAVLFIAIEGPIEDKQHEEIRKNRYDLLSALLKIVQDKDDDVIEIDDKLMIGQGVNEMLAVYEPKVLAYYKKYGSPAESESKRWTFWNAVFFCGTVYTTIGYGHISPSTTTGRAITIIYAIFGIPMFLILLADFGKLFTRGIKFLWAFVRRVYYTGSCRKVRRTGPVQDVIKGVQLVYNFATNRRPSEMEGGGGGGGADPGIRMEGQRSTAASPDMLAVPHTSLGMQQEIGVPLDGSVPSTPMPENFEVDDEFNLPISVAIVVLLLYIFVGATMYFIWETEWGFFESFYFVFISMSTIGFGDFVPQHPMYMMASIVYLIFGLALTSMCINVVQEKLSASFQQASAKIGATIGLHMAEEDAADMEVGEPPELDITDTEQTIKKAPT